MDGLSLNLIFFFMFRKTDEKVQVSLKYERITSTSHDVNYTSLIISRSVLLGLRNAPNNRRREKSKTYITLKTFFRESCLLWDYVEKYFEPDMPRLIIRRMHTASWIPKATNRHSEYVMLIDFPRQLLGEITSLLRYTYIYFILFVFISK